MAIADCDASAEKHGACDNHEVGTKMLRDASDKLKVINEALVVEIRSRTMVDHLLAAAVEQAAGSRFAALHDSLTGLPNRTHFNNRLEFEIARAKKQRWLLAVMFVDLDEFKAINDKYGHTVGDNVLQIVAKRLAQSTRSEDTVSRYGGDEFLCLLAGLTASTDALAVSQQILDAIQAPCEIVVEGRRINLCVKATIGIAMFPQDGATATLLVTQADEFMYRAKAMKSGFSMRNEDRSAS